jgi:hypothetical protein
MIRLRVHQVLAAGLTLLLLRRECLLFGRHPVLTGERPEVRRGPVFNERFGREFRRSARM